MEDTRKATIARASKGWGFGEGKGGGGGGGGKRGREGG